MLRGVQRWWVECGGCEGAASRGERCEDVCKRGWNEMKGVKV